MEIGKVPKMETGAARIKRCAPAARVGLLAVFGALWWVARAGHSLSRLRPVFFAYFAEVLGLSLGFFLADPGLALHLE